MNVYSSWLAGHYGNISLEEVNRNLELLIRSTGTLLAGTARYRERMGEHEE